MKDPILTLIKTELQVAHAANALSDKDELDMQRMMDLLESIDNRVGVLADIAKENDIAPPSKKKSEPEEDKEEKSNGESVSSEMVSKLQEGLKTPAFTEEIEERVETHIVPDIYDTLTPLPADITSTGDVNKEMKRLRTVHEKRNEVWPDLDDEVVVILMTHLIARVRRMQNVIDDVMPIEAKQEKGQLDRIAKDMTRYSKREQPGFIYGLARSHDPKQESWLQDAAYQLHRLEDWIEDAIDEEPPKPSKQNPDQAITFIEQAYEKGMAKADVARMLVSYIEDGTLDVDDGQVVRLGIPVVDQLPSGRFRSNVQKAKQRQESDDGDERSIHEVLDDLKDQYDHVDILKPAYKASKHHTVPNVTRLADTLDVIARIALERIQGEHNGLWRQLLINEGVTGYSPKETETTMSEHGDSRRFNDPELGSHTIQQHVTMHKNSDNYCTQIYFEVVDDRLVIGYVGPHLPYSSH